MILGDAYADQFDNCIIQDYEVFIVVANGVIAKILKRREDAESVIDTLQDLGVQCFIKKMKVE